MANNKPNYLIRTSKHIERRIFAETLQSLNNNPYKLSGYSYVGFGCYFYVDFILFHKMLSIQKMICLEKKRSLESRMKFNKPFKFIDLKIEDCSSYVARLDNKTNYIIWLDYEEPLTSEILTTLSSAVNKIKDGSVIIITVNADLFEVDNNINMTSGSETIKKEIEKINEQIRDHRFKKYKEELSPKCGILKKGDVTPGGLPNLFSRTIITTIKDALLSKPESSYYPLFNYYYTDGARMLTVGGIIDKKNKEKIIDSALKNIKYINKSTEAERIAVPSLTIREKLLIDAKMPKNQSIPRGLPFNLQKAELKNYAKFAKHYPNFYEVFIG